jgi:small GTP-binding protein
MSTCSIKIVAVGDSSVGKTSLLSKYTYDTLSLQYARTVFDNFEVEVKVGGRTHNLVLWDTPGDYDYDQIRPLSYPDTDVFLICYSTVDPTSLTNLWQKWLKEVHKFADANSVIIVVGLKSDARHDDAQRALHARGGIILTTEQGKSFAEAAGAAAFVECSALKSRRVADVFAASAQAGWRSKQMRIKRKSASATEPKTASKSEGWFVRAFSVVGWLQKICPGKRNTSDSKRKIQENRRYTPARVPHA